MPFVQEGESSPAIEVHYEQPKDMHGTPITVGSVVLYPLRHRMGEGVVTEVRQRPRDYWYASGPAPMDWTIMIEIPGGEKYNRALKRYFYTKKQSTRLLNPARTVVFPMEAATFWERHGL